MSDKTNPAAGQASAAPENAEYLTEDQINESTIDGRTWIKTITARSIEAHPERAKTKNKPVLCCRIAGEVRGTAAVPADPKDKSPDREMLTVLVGEFRAESYTDDGEVFSFVGEWCGLPMGQNVILGRIQKMADDGVESIVVRFDFEFAALPASNMTGYRWGARNMMAMEQDASSFLSDARMSSRKGLVSRLLPGTAASFIEHKPNAS